MDGSIHKAHTEWRIRMRLIDWPIPISGGEGKIWDYAVLLDAQSNGLSILLAYDQLGQPSGPIHYCMSCQCSFWS